MLTVDIQHYHGRLQGRVGGPTRAWHEREGLLLRLLSSDGQLGQGEASPLADYSPDTLADARAVLDALDPKWLASLLAGNDTEALLAAVACHPIARIPSARFAVETALLDLRAQREQRPLWAAFTQAPTRIPLAALLPTESVNAGLEAAALGWESGLRCFKLKIAPGPGFQNQLSLLSALRDRYGNALALRLDANQSFTRAQDLDALHQLARFEPEYVEEPCPLPQLETLPALPFSVAFDETLARPDQQGSVLAWLNAHAGTVLVLKPMTLGGFSACFTWAAHAVAHGAKVALSHLFDGPVALTACAHLALSLPAPQLAAGLAPHLGLQIWPRAELPFGGSAIDPSTTTGLGLAPLAGPNAG